MKYLILAICLVVTLPIVFGCSGSAPVYTDPSITINTSAGKQFTIVLDGNATTGYNWEESFDAALLKLAKKEYKEDNAKGVVGAGGKQYFTFEALKAGQTQVTLNYKRAWENEPIEKKVFNVSIK